MHKNNYGSNETIKDLKSRSEGNGTVKRRSNSSKTRGRKVSNKPGAGILVATVLMFIFSAFLIQKLFVIQVVEFDVHTKAASESHYKRIVEIPKRGSIFDKNGRELAFSMNVETIGITPRDLKSRKTPKMSKEAIAKGIADALGMKFEDVMSKTGDMDKGWILLKKRITPAESEKLKAFRNKHEIGGIRIDIEDRRVYPQGSLAGNVIGFTNDEGIGQLGIEYQYNSAMTGEPGYTYAETDNYGQAALPFAVPVSLRARNGLNVISTIDIEIQKILESELQNSIEIYNVSEGGVAIVMDPYTGSVLGMASTPSLNPSDPLACPAGIDPATWNPQKNLEVQYIKKDVLNTKKQTAIEYLQENVWRIRAITNTYEPGSTFKSITAAAAMEEGKFFENEMISSSPIRVSGRTISNAHFSGMSTTEVGFWKSSNPVFVQVAQRVGITKFYNFIRGFGFYEPTGIDLPGEAIGIFHTKPTLLDMSCLAFGEQSTVTPISMINAYSAFANGGMLMKPQVVRSLTDSNNNVVKEYAPESVRQIVSEQTATRIRNLLKGVVLYGTGSKGYVEGYSVGGKTSTSTRLNKQNDISFLSMAPIDQPKIVILVVLFAPDKQYATSSLAALTSGRMTGKILEYMGVPRNYTANDVSVISQKNYVPGVAGKTFKEARTIFQAKGLNIDDPSGVLGDNSKITAQWPLSGQKIHRGGTVAVYTSDVADKFMAVVPDILGKNVNESMRAMTECGINIIIEGDCLGVATFQEFEPGKMTVRRSPMIVKFSAT